jgi:hypothetical protein
MIQEVKDMSEGREGEVIVVETEEDFLRAIEEVTNGGVPDRVEEKSERLSLRKRREEAAHALYDAKPPEKIKEEAEMMPLDKWSQVVERIDKPDTTKLDVNVTAMGLLGLFPVAKEIDG